MYSLIWYRCFHFVCYVRSWGQSLENWAKAIMKYHNTHTDWSPSLSWRRHILTVWTRICLFISFVPPFFFSLVYYPFSLLSLLFDSNIWDFIVKIYFPVSLLCSLLSDCVILLWPFLPTNLSRPPASQSIRFPVSNFCSSGSWRTCRLKSRRWSSCSSPKVWTPCEEKTLQSGCYTTPTKKTTKSTGKTWGRRSLRARYTFFFFLFFFNAVRTSFIVA